MKKIYKKFNMSEPPRKTLWFLKPIQKLLVSGGFKQHQPKITYVNTKDIKPPFLLLCNHNAFLDFKVASTLLNGKDANWVVAIDGFIGREWIMRNVGCMCKRKFTNDTLLIKQLVKSVRMGNVPVIYPEARYSLCGTTAVLPESLGKLAKFLKVPVVTLICHGHHVNSPFWDSSHERGVVPTEATYKLLVSQEEINTLSYEEINNRIVDEFQYDDFKWQLDNKVSIKEDKRAEGLHRVLYQCPNCNKEYEMESFGITLRCKACNKTWEMSEYGELEATDKKDIFRHIPDWYEWERKNVRKEIEDGTYSTGNLQCHVDSLPNSKGFVHLGKGVLVHDMNGFRVEGTDVDGDHFEMVRPVNSMYSCHIEYQYLFKYGDCIDLNTLEDTYYIYPEGDQFAVTKMALATEELYFHYLRSQGKEVKKGLA